jgi:predicted RNA-binding protein Jag
MKLIKIGICVSSVSMAIQRFKPDRNREIYAGLPTPDRRIIHQKFLRDTGIITLSTGRGQRNG